MYKLNEYKPRTRNQMRNFENSKDLINEVEEEINDLEIMISDCADNDNDDDIERILDYTDARTVDQAKRKATERIAELAELLVYGDFAIHEDDIDYHIQLMLDEIVEESGVNINTAPFDCIDWDEAIENYKRDFTMLEVDGTSFYVL